MTHIKDSDGHLFADVYSTPMVRTNHHHRTPVSFHVFQSRAIVSILMVYV